MASARGKEAAAAALAVIAMITSAPGWRVYVRTVYALLASAVYRPVYSPAGSVDGRERAVARLTAEK